MTLREVKEDLKSLSPCEESINFILDYIDKNIILKRSDVEKYMNECHERVVYWEKVYRIVREEDKNNENLNSYKRQINIWLAKYEVWRDILR